MTAVRVLRSAQAEIRAAALWYESKRTGLGIDFIAVVDEALSMIGKKPLSCPLWRKDRDYRRKNVRRFPYSVFFTLAAEGVTIVAVAHQRRRPGYWVGRT